MQDERPEIHMPGLDAAIEETGGGRKLDGRLSDISLRLRLKLLGKRFALGFRRVRADQHAVAAGFAHRFDHQPIQICQDMGEHLGLAAKKGLYVLEYWLF